MPQNALAPTPRNAMLRPYEPTWKEQIAAYLMGDTRPSPERRQFATGISNILGYLPGVGNVIQAQEAAKAGDTKGAMLAMLPLPGANVAAKAEQAIAQDVAKGIRAYHGSPHSFERFDTSKIGTGEGAQAFGRGLYFAEQEPIAKSYRDALSGDELLLDNKLFLDRRGNQHISTGNDYLDDILSEFNGDIESAIQQQNIYRNNLLSIGSPTSHVDDTISSLEKLRGRISKSSTKGHMYEVNINARPEELLDWDKPLSIQPAVRDKLLTPEVRQGINEYRKGWGLSPINENATNITGEELMNYLEQPVYATKGDPAAAAEFVRQAGVPGVKYLDRGSRAAGEGSRNYVVFDDKIVEIMRKYGLMGPIGAGIAAKILERQEQRQEM